jgi:hypothetical protein
LAYVYATLANANRERRPTVAHAEAAVHLEVGVLYNGMTRQVRYHPREQGRALFERACHVFEIRPPDRGPLALFLPDNSTEVRPDVTVEDAGVHPDTTLVLRPREASTGAA